MRRAISCVLLAVVAGLAAAAIGLHQGLPEAPWGEEHLRQQQIIEGSLRAVLLPWAALPEDAEPPVAWARWTLPAALLAAFGLAGAGAVRAQARRARIGRQGGHIVVAGATALGRELQAAWSLRQRPMMAVSEAEGHAAAPGVLALGGSLSDARILQRCHLDKAERLVLTGPDDGRNLADALAVAEHCAQVRPADLHPLSLWVRIEDPFHASALQTRLAAERAADAVEVRVFSVGQIALRHTLRQAPAWRHQVLHRPDGVCLVIGANALAEALVLQVLQTEVLREAARPRFAIVAADAEAFLARLQARWPGVQAVADWTCLPWQPEQTAEAFAALQAGVGAPSVAFFCLEAAASNLACAAQWAQAWQAQGCTPPPAYAYDVDGHAAALAQRLLPGAMFRGFGEAAVVAEELAGGDALDMMARSIHEAYLQDALARGEPMAARRSLQPWRLLGEDLRNDNRVAADHQFTKLAATGWAAVPPASGMALAWTEAEVEAQARLEHERWWRNRLLAGWQFAAVRDDAQRRHPDLLPYDSLGEDRRELDRAVVRGVPQRLQAAGIGVHRECSLLVAGPAAPWAFTPAFEQQATAVLQAFFSARPVPARVLWVLGPSAMAWRVAELWLQQGGGRLGVVFTQALDRLLLDADASPAAARVQALVRSATASLRLPPGLEGDAAWQAAGAALAPDAALGLSIEGPQPPVGLQGWGLDAHGRCRPTERFKTGDSA